MSPLFGKKKAPPGKTVLLVDIESGSAGAALVRLLPNEQPRLFGERRTHFPLGMSRHGAGLAAALQSALHKALAAVSETAARLRLHPKTSPLGEVAAVRVTLAPPWGKPDLEQGRPEFLPDAQTAVRHAVERYFGERPIAYHTSAGVAAHAVRQLYGDEPCLLCLVTGEVTELMQLDAVGVRAHATLPTGTHALLRTLRAHGNFSEAEARSAARLPFETAHLREPFAAATHHFAEQASEVLREFELPPKIRVVAAEPSAEWFARGLSASPHLHNLYPQGGEVRAVLGRHCKPHLSGHAPQPDLPLMLGALFVDSGERW